MIVFVTGTGMYLPPYRVTNADLEKVYPIKGRLIDKIFGIDERRYAYDFANWQMRPGEYDSDMGERAARAALEDAGVTVSDIDAFIYTTSTPDYIMPDSACDLHERLGASEDAAAFFLLTGCGGMIYAIVLGRSLILSGQARRVLVVASNSTSAFADKEQLERDRWNAAIFGDGASALILDGERKGIEVVATYWGATGVGNPITVPAGGCRRPTTRETVARGEHWYKMDLTAVKENAPRFMRKSSEQVLASVGLTMADVRWFIFHQANRLLVEQLARLLEIPEDRLINHVREYGNTVSADLGIALHEARRARKLTSGDHILMASVGAGWQYGAILLKA